MVAAFLSLEGFDEVELHIVGDSHSVFSGNDYRLEGNPRVRVLGRLDDEQLVREYQAPPHSSFRRSTKASAYRRWRLRPVAAR